MVKKIIYSISIFFLFSVFPQSLKAQEVILPKFKSNIILKIVRATPDSFETYSLANQNGREMTLVCAQNRFYESNLKAFIEYRNYYNEIAGVFTIEDNSICKQMARFIEVAHSAIDESRPFIIFLNRKLMKVDKIIYPQIDPLAEKGEWRDLLQKPEVLINPRPTMMYNAN